MPSAPVAPTSRFPAPLRAILPLKVLVELFRARVPLLTAIPPVVFSGALMSTRALPFLIKLAAPVIPKVEALLEFTL